MFTPSDLQAKAIKSIADWHRGNILFGAEPFYLAGYAGSGKTSILPHIIEECGLSPSDVTFCAPTGKAAKVMTKKLRAVYNSYGVTAATIHSKIYIPMRERVELLRERIRDLEQAIRTLKANNQSTPDGNALTISQTFEGEVQIEELEQSLKQAQRDFDEAQRDSHRQGLQFLLNPESQVKNSRLIVVDEASMVGEDIAEDLLSFGIPVLAIGDPAQLPPVGDKPGLTVGDPDFFLNEIHRQAADNPIIRLSMDIRDGKMLRPGQMGDQVRIVRRRDDDWTLNPDYDAQVICGTHKKRWSLTNQIRKMCGYYSSGPEVDEPLMVCKNSKKAPALVNGSFVVCVESPGDLIDGDASFDLKVEDEDGTIYNLKVNQGQFEEHHLRQKDGATAGKYQAFDSKRFDEILDWGWVITAHKSQGSQWDNVIVHDESGVFRQDADRWLYTACTRAAEELTVVVT